MNIQQATIIIVGDEVLIGQVIDTNSGWIAQQLNALGVALHEVITVSDSAEGITSAMQRATEQSDLVLMTGGLGPTKDDITKKVIADFYSDEMVYDENTYIRLGKLMRKYGRTTTESHKKQCFMPSSACLLINDMGTAPGMLFERSGHVLVSMPGVPYEMKYIMTHHVLPYVSKKVSGNAIHHRTIHTAGEGETIIARRIEPIIDRLPSNISTAFLPNLGGVRIRLSGTGEDKALLENEMASYINEIAKELGSIVFGYDGDSLVKSIGTICKEKNLTIGTAESCTGGKMASMIINESGSSAFYEGSVVSYSNKLKQQVLGVKESTLTQHGAVSESTVREMVLGAVNTLGVDVAVAVSGIAGPSGGTPEKPVGTVWIACGNAEHIETQLITATKDREKNIVFSCVRALDLLRRYLTDYKA